MALKYADRVLETSTTTGLGTFDLAGVKSGGYQTFVAGIGSTNTCLYCIELPSADEWEVGIGTITDAATDTLARTTILASSNAGSAVNFSAGTKNVFQPITHNGQNFYCPDGQGLESVTGALLKTGSGGGSWQAWAASDTAAAFIAADDSGNVLLSVGQPDGGTGRDTYLNDLTGVTRLLEYAHDESTLIIRNDAGTIEMLKVDGVSDLVTLGGNLDMVDNTILFDNGKGLLSDIGGEFKTGPGGKTWGGYAADNASGGLTSSDHLGATYAVLTAGDGLGGLTSYFVDSATTGRLLDIDHKNDTVTFGGDILGDFSNVNHNNRVLFQTTTTNDGTVLGVVPNGTGIFAQANFYDAADPENAGFIAIGTAGVDNYIQSKSKGTGTTLPLAFYIDADKAVEIGTDLSTTFGGDLHGASDSDATASTRPTFVTNGTNKGTVFQTTPSGTGDGSYVVAYLENDPDNSPFAGVGIDASSARVFVGALGTGTQPPMAFRVNGTDRIQIDTDGTLKSLDATYETLVTADDDIPNKKYVDDAITAVSGISNVVEDTSPQLGGNLDVNDFDIIGKPSAGASSPGGSIDIIAADGGATTGDGGDVNITAGSGQNVGGAAVISAGDNTNDIGGYVDLIPGNSVDNGSSAVRMLAKAGSLEPPWFEFHEAPNNGTNSVRLKAPTSVTTTRTWTLPVDDPTTANGKYLKAGANGALSFDTPAGALDTSGTPANDQLAIWVDADTLEGNPELTYTAGSLRVGNTAAGEIRAGTGQNLTIAGGTGAASLTITGPFNGSGAGGSTTVGGGTGSTIGGPLYLNAGSALSGATGTFIRLTPGTGSTTAGYIEFAPPGSGDRTPVSVRFKEDGSNGGNYVALEAPASVTTDRTWKLPQDDPSTASGKFLTTDASGVLSFSEAVTNPLTSPLDCADNAVYGSANPSSAGLPIATWGGSWNNNGDVGAIQVESGSDTVNKDSGQISFYVFESNVLSHKPLLINEFGQLVTNGVSDLLGAEAGSMTISTGNSGVTGPGASHDDLLIESGADSGIGIFCPDANIGQIRFGTPSEQTAAVIRWDHGTAGANIAFEIGTTMAAADTFIMEGNGNRRVGVFSQGWTVIGDTTSDALPAGIGLTVSTGNSGITSPDVNADDLVVESGGSTGISICTPNTATGAVYFSDPEGTAPGAVFYNHTDNALTLRTSGGNRLIVESDGTLTTGTTDYETLVTADDDIPNKKFCDDTYATLAATSQTFTGAMTINGEVTGKANTNNFGSGLGTGDARLTVGVGRTGSGNSFLDLIGDTTYTGYGLRVLRAVTGGANAPSWIYHRGTSSLNVFAVDAGTVRLGTQNASRMTVESNGTVRVDTANYENLVTSDDDIPNRKFCTDTFSDKSTATTQTHVGNIQIKKAAPFLQLWATTAGNNNIIQFLGSDSNTDGYLYFSQASSVMNLETRNTGGQTVSAVVLKQGDGNIQIKSRNDGTTTAPVVATFNSGFHVNCTATQWNVVGGNGFSAQPNGDIAVARTGLTAVFNRSDNSTTNLEVFRVSRKGAQAGGCYASSTVVQWTSVSDYRLKENIVGLTDGVDRVNLLNPVRFNFKKQKYQTVDGFLAHEAQAVVPESVAGQKDAVDAAGEPQYQTMDNAKLVPILVAAIQELSARVAALEAAAAE